MSPGWTLLVQEIVPGAPRLRQVLTISDLIREYEWEAHPFAKDFSALHAIIKVLRLGNQCRLVGQLDFDHETHRQDCTHQHPVEG